MWRKQESIQAVHKMYFHALVLDRARKYSMLFAEVYVQKKIFSALSNSPTKIPIFSDFPQIKFMCPSSELA